MGLFSFLKDAGAKLLGIESAEAATPESLEAQLKGHGFDAGKLKIDVDGDTVKVTGDALSTEEAEKIALALGNVVGVSKVDTGGLKVATASADSVMYTVKKGDTLWKIAETHYGKGKGDRYKDIVAANTPPVKNPDLIQPGWVLRIPPLA